MKWIALSLALTALVGSVRADAVDDLVRAEMKKDRVPGMVIGIVRDGKLVRTSSYGMADLELNVKTKDDMLFEIGSMTKQFTAFGAMLLVDQGKLSIDDPVSKYLREAPASWSQMKVSNLLYQTSGLPDYAFVAGLALTDEFDRKAFFDKIAAMPLDFPVGSTWAYSNTNYALMGWIIEKASGKPYTQFIQENILKPLGMNHTVYGTMYDILPNRAAGYYNMEPQHLMRAKPSGASIDSDGSLLSCVQDLAIWDKALADRKLLSKAGYERIWSPAVLNSGHKRFYGMGWFLSPYGIQDYVGHGGNSSGYSAGLARYPDEKLSVIVLSNVYAIGGEAFAKKIAETIDPKVKWPVPSEAPDPNTKRTEELKTALSELAAKDVSGTFLEPDMTAPLKTLRLANAFVSLKNLDKLAFCSEKPYGDDTLLTYDLTATGHPYTLMALWSKEGKLAHLILQPRGA
ncbi:MAG TPA: serine hydrolase domain-containing protein [Fimbriimonas sp.]|nr:serine hydrolase domain-containing protein [Fimbriimonas sp.]